MEEHKTNSDIRIANTKRVVNLLFRNGQMTKQEIAQRLKISQPTVATIIKLLEDRGLVKDGEVLSSTGGRKPRGHMPVYDAKYAIGVEASRQLVRIVMLDLGSNCLATEKYTIERRHNLEYWEEVNVIIAEFIEKNHVNRDKLLDIGVTIDETMMEELIIQYSEENISVHRIEETLQFKAFVRSASKMAAIAQIWADERRNKYLYINLGSNIRGAMVYDGTVLDFMQINCEFGNFILSEGDCENPVRLGELLSAARLLERAGLEHMEDFMNRLSEGDQTCRQLYQKFEKDLSIFLYNMHMLYGWDIVIGGRSCALVETYQENILSRIRSYYPPVRPDSVIFEISKNWKLSAAMGAAMLPIDRYLSSF